MTTVRVTLNDGSQEEIVVHGIPLRAFELAAQMLEAKDEFGLIALSIGRPREWVLDHVAPGSLAELANAMQAENTAFFGWHARRALLGLQPAEMLRLQRDLQAAMDSHSGAMSPGSQRQPA